MEILIVCNQTDCVYNREEWFIHYGKQTACTLASPHLCKQGIKKLCLSKTKKQSPKNACDNCDDKHSELCVSCCHKNFGNKFI